MSTTQSRTRTLLIGGGAGVAAVGAAIGLFFAGDAPGTVDIDDALAQAEQAGSSEAAGDDAQAPAGDGAVDPQGTWTVDTGAEPFDFASSSGTFLGFRIAEELTTVGATEAVGRTPTVTGALTLEGSVVTAAEFAGDVDDITTDVPRRDNLTRSALGAAEHPLVTFVLAAPIDLGRVPSAGETFDVTATGELTVNGVTRQVEVPLQAALSSSGVLVITSSFDVVLADHGVTPPKAGPVISVADVATVEVQLYLTRA